GIWHITEGTSYPVLQWQTTAAPRIASANSYKVGSVIGGTFLVTAIGVPPVYSYSITDAPAGVSIDSSTGEMTINGNLPVGTYTFKVTAVNGIEPDATQLFTLIVEDKPVLKAGVPSQVTAEVIMGSPYTLNLNNIFKDPNGGTLTYLVSVNNGAFTAASASYTYTPQTPETTNLTFKARNADG
ncbi:cadherin repeat domain-containing protein, partial [Syntrophomonas palmitatica]|uniref:cadherin repeat domain-containing protein n=1 Tax=Syntrophomonas palmitatica TaxID=402877 RepID=UPI000ACBBD49